VRERIGNYAKNKITEVVIKSAINYAYPRAVVGLNEILDYQRRASDPTVYREHFKRLGVLSVSYAPLGFDFFDSGRGISIGQDDRVLQIHLPVVDPRKRKLSEVTNSMRLVAEYIKLQGFYGNYIVGTTYERLASASQRFGFRLTDCELPDSFVKSFNEKTALYERAGVIKNPGEPRLIIQSVGDFIARYGRPTQSQS
jgi:hypothetical protein